LYNTKILYNNEKESTQQISVIFDNNKKTIENLSTNLKKFDENADAYISKLEDTKSVKMIAMENEFKTVTKAKGLEIPKYSKDFKKLVEKDRQLAEYLCINYENLDSEDLGAFLETVEQGISWILDLIESKDLLYKPKSGSNHAKRK